MSSPILRKDPETVIHPIIEFYYRPVNYFVTKLSVLGGVVFAVFAVVAGSCVDEGGSVAGVGVFGGGDGGDGDGGDGGDGGVGGGGTGGSSDGNLVVMRQGKVCNYDRWKERWVSLPQCFV